MEDDIPTKICRTCFKPFDAKLKECPICKDLKKTPFLFVSEYIYKTFNKKFPRSKQRFIVVTKEALEFVKKTDINF